ncbi:MAG TPA: 50S ribosomal protein L1 [Phycisphaerae bacterium]|nr:50S ribosomal protein L1 [Phycisphaerae bacterium]HRR86790.1 50S ribosomal protein L1 [Phycisphaerae bacterium]
MPRQSARYKLQLETRGNAARLSIPEAVKLVKSMAAARPEKKDYKGRKKPKGFDQTVELVCWLGVDPRQADQALRGAVSLPKGIGKSKRVIAFCPDDMAEKAKAAGAVDAGADELIKKVNDGWTDFDVAVAHPAVMGKVGKLGRVLGPQGKMPSPKSGTVTPDIEQAVREYSAGKVEFRTDAGGNVHAPVGKVSFPDQDLVENIEAFIAHIRRSKPATSKGQYFKRVCLTATMTPSVTLDVG